MATLSVDPRVFSGWLFLTGSRCWFFYAYPTNPMKKLTNDVFCWGPHKKKLLRFIHPSILVLLVQLGILRVPGFFNTFSKTLHPRFYELRRIWDMTLTWIFSDFKKMFKWNVSQTCDFPILLEQQILFGTTKSIQKKNIPFNFKKNTISPTKRLHPKFLWIFLFILLGFLVNFLFI